jgi:hypothetical protein
LKWANGGIVFFFAVMIASWLAAIWFVLVRPPAPLFAFLSGRFIEAFPSSGVACEGSWP